MRVRLKGRSSSPEAAAFGVVEAPLARDVEAAVHGRFLWSASKVARGSGSAELRKVASEECPTGIGELGVKRNKPGRLEAGDRVFAFRPAARPGRRRVDFDNRVVGGGSRGGGGGVNT